MCTNLSFFCYRWENYRKQHTSSTAKLADMTDSVERVRLWSKWPWEETLDYLWFCYRQFLRKNSNPPNRQIWPIMMRAVKMEKKNYSCFLHSFSPFININRTAMRSATRGQKIFMHNYWRFLGLKSVLYLFKRLAFHCYESFLG